MPAVAGSVAFVVAAAAMRFLRRPIRAHRRPLVHAVAAIAALAAGFASGGDATGWSVLDVLLRVALAALVTEAAALAAYGWVAAGVGALAAGSYGTTETLGSATAAAVGVAAVLLVVGAGNRVLQATAAGLAVIGLLHLGDPGPVASIAVGVPVVALLAAPAIHRLGYEARRRVVLGLVAAALVVIVGGVVGLVAAVGARDDMQEAADLALDGLELLGDDDVLAAAMLEGAAEQFDDAAGRLDAWWARPARLVPVVSQHVRAASTMASVGRRLASAAESAVRDVDLAAVRIERGTVDVGVVRALAGPAAGVAEDLDVSLRRLAGVDSPWLLSELRDPLEDMTARVDDARAGAHTVADVASILPALLGADGERRYLLLVQNPAEAAGSGGFPGNFGEILALDGHVDLIRTGRLDDLTEVLSHRAWSVDMAPEVEDLYSGGDASLVTWQNSTASPDFAEVASIVAQLYAQSGGSVVDGVLSVDPIALDAMLELTGPVRLPSSGVRLESGSAARLFLHEQYVTYDERDERGRRIDLLDEATEAVWDAFTAGDIGSLRRFTEVLGETVRGEHVQFWSFDGIEQQVLGRLGITGQLPALTSDGIGAVVHQNSLNKMDWFVDRSSVYRARWNPRTGDVEGTLGVRIANRAPDSGLPEAVIGWGGRANAPGRTAPGEWAGIVFVYSATPPTAVRVGGQPVGFAPLRHQGWYVTPVSLRVPSGGVGEVDVDVAGRVSRGAYDLATVHQASVNGDDLSVVVELAGGDPRRYDPVGDAEHLGGGGTFSASVTLDRSFRFGIIRTDR